MKINTGSTTGAVATFEIVETISARDKAKLAAELIRGMTAAGDPAQPDETVLRTVPFADCAPCVEQAQRDWTDRGHIDWSALTAAGDLIEIDPADPGRFVAILAVEEEQTADKRIIAEGAASWRTPPLSLMLMTKTADGHDGAVVCAVIEQIMRDGNQILATGRFDNGEAGIEAARLVANQVLTGVSIDAGDVVGEVLVTAEDENGVPTDGLARMTALTILGATICPFQAIGSACIAYISPDGALAENDAARFGEDVMARFAAAEAAEEATATLATLAMEKHAYVDENNSGKCDVCGTSKDEHDAAMENLSAEGQFADHAFVDKNKDGKCDVCGKPAFVHKKSGAAAELLVAAGPIKYAPSMFADPHLSGPTPITVDDDGHVFGHAAIFGQCHISFPGACVTPPKTRTNYGHYRTGSVRLTDDTVQPVGTISMNASHADQKLSARETAAHYDHTGLAAAFVNVGEDAHGIWVSGVLRPDLSEADATVLAASSLSGDWRRIGGNLELVALLSVNTPGFPIAHTVNDEQLALVAAGFGHVPASDAPPEKPVNATLNVNVNLDEFAEGFAALIEDTIAPIRAELDAFKAEMRPLRMKALAEAFAAGSATRKEEDGVALVAPPAAP